MIVAGVSALPAKFPLAISKWSDEQILSFDTFQTTCSQIRFSFAFRNRTIFAFIARRSTSSHDNQCHVFCELEPNQPAAAIAAFANKVIPSYGAQPYLRDIWGSLYSLHYARCWAATGHEVDVIDL